MKRNFMTHSEIMKIQELYQAGFIAGDGKLELLCSELGRTKQLICRYAKKINLTDFTRAVDNSLKLKTSTFNKNWIKENGHPKGMLGKKHKPELTKVYASKSREMWAGWSDEKKIDWKIKGAKTRSLGNPINTRKSTWKSQWSSIAGKEYFFRSEWEKLYAKHLQEQKEKGEIMCWEFEPKVFLFDVTTTPFSYKPDFRITKNDSTIEYHEVKGWFCNRSEMTLSRMKKFYPNVHIEIIDSKYFKRTKSETRFIRFNLS